MAGLPTVASSLAGRFIQEHPHPPENNTIGTKFIFDITYLVICRKQRMALGFKGSCIRNKTLALFRHVPMRNCRLIKPKDKSE